MAVIEREIVDPTSVYAEHVKGRVLVYLDNNIWIDLADKKTPDAVRCLDALSDAVRRKLVLVPLSYPSISELLDNPDPAAQLEQARIMDELSEGVSFRSRWEIVKLEAEAAAPFLFGEAPGSVDRTKLFTYVVGFLGDAVMDFPPGWTREQIDGAMQVLRGHTSMRSVSWLVQNAPVASMQKGHRRMKDERMASGVGDATIKKIAAASRRPDGKLHRNAILTRERVAVYELVYPELRMAALLSRPLPEAVRLVQAATAREGPGGPDKLAQLLKAMPCCDLFAEVMAVRDMSPDRRERVQDHLDNEHARIAPAYVDAFVTLDGGLREILKRCTVPAERGCKVVGSLPALTDYLEQLGRERAA